MIQGFLIIFFIAFNYIFQFNYICSIQCQTLDGENPWNHNVNNQILNKLVPQIIEPTDPVERYLKQYGWYPPENPPVPESSPTDDNLKRNETMENPQENKSESATEENADAALDAITSMTPDTALQLKNTILSEKEKLHDVQKLVSELLTQLKQERDRITQEKAYAAAEKTDKNKLSFSIEFPNSQESNSSESNEKALDQIRSVENLNQVNKPIPVIVIKPDPKTELEILSQDIMEEDISKEAIQQTEDSAKNLELKSPEELINESIAKIDKLEARKARLNIEGELLKRKVG